MKKLGIGVFVGCLFASLSMFAQSSQTFTGEVIDSQCGAMHGHQMMMKQGESPKDCTNRCVKMGGKYALYDPAAKKSYELDDQTKTAAFAGEKVAITGTLNAATKTIHVTGVKAAS